jgi:hypothetical protein
MTIFKFIPFKEIFAQINPNLFVYVARIVDTPIKPFVNLSEVNLSTWAARNGYSHILKELLPFTTPESKQYIYFAGCESGDYKTLRMLLKHGMSFTKGPNAESYFKAALSCYRVVKPYLKYNYTTCKIAVSGGHLYVLKKLLKRIKYDYEQIYILTRLSIMFIEPEITEYLLTKYSFKEAEKDQLIEAAMIYDNANKISTVDRLQRYS